jgi:hypothetical protein|uniref:Uncharacterized protein n=1 Tax=viral metagenome TaxID=1070528 RepID=A0A6C0IT31_9ZZZZ
MNFAINVPSTRQSRLSRRTQQRARHRNISRMAQLDGVKWTTCTFTHMQPVENVSFLNVMEKVVWGSFNCLTKKDMTFDDMQTYHTINEERITDLGIVHHLYMHDIIRSNQNKQNVSKLWVRTKVNEIMNNKFISKADKTNFFDMYSLCQKHYTALSRFAFICRFKLAKVGCDTDMYMSPISKAGSNFVEILHANRRYAFTISDIIKIIRKSLSTSSEMYADPQTIKNPYNNISFTKSNLYAIYFAIKKSDYNIPILFQQYFICNFSLSRLLDDCETQLREIAIRENCHPTEDDCVCELCENIYDMLEIYNDTHFEFPINVDNEFPEKILIDTFKPYMKHYYRSMYSLTLSEKIRSRIYWLATMKKFASENPSFGRKIIKTTTDLNNKRKSVISYITDVASHISPCNYNIEETNSHVRFINTESDFVNSYRKDIRHTINSRQRATLGVNVEQYNQTTRNEPYPIPVQHGYSTDMVRLLANYPSSGSSSDSNTVSSEDIIVDNVGNNLYISDNEEEEGEEMETDSIS